jgi:capsular polysaccharide biosynthesis protein
LVLVAAGLLLVAVGVGIALAVIPTAYEASVTVTLVPSEGNRDFALATGATNALLGIDRDMAVVAGVVRAGVAGNRNVLPPRLRHPHTTYELAISGGVGSDLTVTVKSRSSRNAVATVDALERAIDDELASRQVDLGVPTDSRITARAVTSPGVSTDTSRRVRVAAVALGVGVFFVLLIAFALEGLAQRRERRRALGAGPGVHDPNRAPRVRIVATLVVLALVSVGCALLVRAADSQWQATATLALVPPKFPVNTALPVSQQGTPNPFLSYTSSMSTLGRVAATQWASQPDRVHDVVVQDWQAGATPVDTSAAPTPLLIATATAGSADTASSAANTAADQLATIVRQLQEQTGAPWATFVTVVGAGDPTLAAVDSGRARATAALALLSLIVALLVGRLVELLVVARRREEPATLDWRVDAI